MYILYHQPLCPFSRKVRFLLAQKNIEFNLIKENFWERRDEFIAINTMGTVPVLFDNNNQHIICGSPVIVEYIEEKHDDSKSYLGDSLTKRAEVRRIQIWFDEKFYNEVSKLILKERFFDRFTSSKLSPDPDNIRLAKNNLNIHLNYMEFLLENRKYLAGDKISVADFAAAGHISAIDYFGDINWQNRDIIKEWYLVVKSQKGLPEILKDRIPGVVPPRHYDKLDF
ncbi:MAG: glutathione S-transferase family protein [Rickettsiaceae bacterium]|jgi:glutathione S-transferase|nr:glutathione S-transferase family protein [Rickettsiaceae bacterium]